MFQAALLAVVLAANGSAPQPTHKSAIQACFGTMDGAVYNGDPADRRLMKANVAACNRGLAAIAAIKPTPAQGPEKLFLSGRLLDRAATLSYMGLGDARTALAEVERANLYFRVASGLPGESADYRAAASANVHLTEIQLATLRSDIASTKQPRPAVALRSAHRLPRAEAITAYHKL